MLALLQAKKGRISATPQATIQTSRSFVSIQKSHQATISTIATTESKVTTPTIRYSLITQTPHQATGWLTMLPVRLRHATNHLAEYEDSIHLFFFDRLPWAIGLVV